MESDGACQQKYPADGERRRSAAAKGKAILHYDEYGNGNNPLLVLLNDAYYVDSLHKQYALSDCFHVVVPHLPGAGRAAKEDYDPTETVHAIAELIYSLGGRASIIGYGLGAALSLALAARCEPLVSRAAFLSPNVLPAAQHNVPAHPPARLTARLRGLTREQADYLAAYVGGIPKETARAISEKRIALSALERYPYVKTPMLAVCGGLEANAVRASARMLSERNPKCELRVLRGAGGNYPLRRAERLNPILIDFLTNSF